MVLIITLFSNNKNIYLHFMNRRDKTNTSGKSTTSMMQTLTPMPGREGSKWRSCHIIFPKPCGVHSLLYPPLIPLPLLLRLLWILPHPIYSSPITFLILFFYLLIPYHPPYCVPSPPPFPPSLLTVIRWIQICEGGFWIYHRIPPLAHSATLMNGTLSLLDDFSNPLNPIFSLYLSLHLSSKYHLSLPPHIPSTYYPFIQW